jgi:aminopeptidase N
MADFDLDFRYPAEWTLLATGSKVESGAADDPSEVRTHWRTDRPIPVAGFNLGKYASASTSAGQVTVESYATTGVERSFPKGRPETVTVPTIRPREQIEEQVLILPPPPSPARNARIVADKAAEALEFYADRFGPYPYKSLRLTQMPGTLSQGWPGLIFLSTFGFLSPEERAQLNLNRVEALLDGQLIAHETAHQWWGDLVLWKSYRDQWVFEGLSNYCALMLLEKDDPAAFRVVMDHYRHDLLLKNKDGDELREAGPVTLGLRLSSSRFPHGYEAISYGRGTWLFHMLRHMLNDGRTADAKAEEPFVRALRHLREQMEGKVVTTERVLQAFESEAQRPLWFEGKKSLDWFLDSWINGNSIPQIELKGVKLQKRQASVTVTGSILQRSAADDLVTSVPLYAVLPGKKLVFIGRVFADGAESSFRMNAPADTERIVVDPNDTVLSRHN